MGLWGKNSKVLTGIEALAWLRKVRSGADPEPTEHAQLGYRGPVDVSQAGSSGNAQPHHAYRPKESDTWTCETMEVAGKCPILDVDKTTVRIPYPFYFTWQMLAGKHKDEWFAYLTGDYDEAKGNATIDGYYFPPQRVGGAHCEPVQGAFQFRPRTIGSVHSHNQMGAFFSGTDLAHMNWQVEMVINAKGDMVGKTRVKFECGRFGRYDASLKLVQPAGMGEEAALELDAALEAGKKSGREPEKEEHTFERFGYGGYHGV